MTRSDGKQETLLQLFSALASDLALGITEWTMPNSIKYRLGRPSTIMQLAIGTTAQEFLEAHDSDERIINSPYPRGPGEGEIRSIISNMILAGAIAIEHRPGLPNREGEYVTIQNMPADIYRITDLGLRVVTRLGDSVYE